MSRNLADVALSIYMTPYEISPDFAHVRENIVFACRQHESLMNHWKSVLPEGSILEIEYEDLVENGPQTVAKVLTYCNLPQEEGCLRPDENNRSVNTPSVWQVRQPIYRSSKGRWKDYKPFLGAFSQLLPANYRA